MTKEQKTSHGWFSKSVYSTCYFLSYGVVFPTLWVAGLVPTDNAMGHGFRDGADAAKQAVARTRERMSHPRASKEAHPSKA